MTYWLRTLVVLRIIKKPSPSKGGGQGEGKSANFPPPFNSLSLGEGLVEALRNPFLRLEQSEESSEV